MPPCFCSKSTLKRKGSNSRSPILLWVWRVPWYQESHLQKNRPASETFRFGKRMKGAPHFTFHEITVVCSEFSPTPFGEKCKKECLKEEILVPTFFCCTLFWKMFHHRNVRLNSVFLGWVKGAPVDDFGTPEQQLLICHHVNRNQVPPKSSPMPMNFIFNFILIKNTWSSRFLKVISKCGQHTNFKMPN